MQLKIGDYLVDAAHCRNINDIIATRTDEFMNCEGSFFPLFLMDVMVPS